MGRIQQSSRSEFKPSVNERLTILSAWHARTTAGRIGLSILDKEGEKCARRSRFNALRDDQTGVIDGSDITRWRLDF
ncbi:MAG TPA: hypothetical protein VK438_01415 [Xanthobacteraceae bacterium]|nr:hypothetical protein [Xanthobacteraceae bacterium]